MRNYVKINLFWVGLYPYFIYELGTTRIYIYNQNISVFETWFTRPFPCLYIYINVEQQESDGYHHGVKITSHIQYYIGAEKKCMHIPSQMVRKHYPTSNCMELSTTRQHSSIYHPACYYETRKPPLDPTLYESNPVTTPKSYPRSI